MVWPHTISSVSPLNGVSGDKEEEEENSTTTTTLDGDNNTVGSFSALLLPPPTTLLHRLLPLHLLNRAMEEVLLPFCCTHYFNLLPFFFCTSFYFLFLFSVCNSAKDTSHISLNESLQALADPLVIRFLKSNT